MEIRLIVGLGNPGRQYEGTRHNVGFMVLDGLARGAGCDFTTVPKWQAHLARESGGGAVLMKPQTFMNLSGRSIRAWLAFHQVPPEKMLVIYDDVALPLGTLRFREKGSAGGHNGIKSIIQELATDVFPRLKVGIGGSDQRALVGHVLGNFTADERAEVENTLATACEAVQFARSQGLAAAANRYHARKPIPKSPNPEANHEPQIPGPDRP